MADLLAALDPPISEISYTGGQGKERLFVAVRPHRHAPRRRAAAALQLSLFASLLLSAVPVMCGVNRADHSRVERAPSRGNGGGGAAALASSAAARQTGAVAGESRRETLSLAPRLAATWRTPVGVHRLRYQGKRGGSAVLTAAGNQALSPPPPSVPPPAPLSAPSPKQSLSLSLAAATPAEAETEAEAEAVGGGGKLRAAIARLNARSGQRESSGNFTAGAAGAAAAAAAAAEVSSPSVPFNNITFNNITFNNVTLNNAPLNKPLSKGGMKHGCHRWPCSARPGLCGVMHRPIRVYLICLCGVMHRPIHVYLIWFGPFSAAQKNILRGFIRPRLVGHQPSVPRLQGPPGFLLRDAQRRVIIPVRPPFLPPPGFPPPDFRRPDFPPPIFQPPIFQPPGYPAFG
ncbi:unnamed protein product [Closterium sp. Naga37s-1]|nr:unnamed protein product [Closterium sp. Naga37s-1]